MVLDLHELRLPLVDASGERGPQIPVREVVKNNIAAVALLSLIEELTNNSDHCV